MTKSLLEEMWDKINGLETKVEGLELWAKGIGEEVGRLISPIRADENKKLLARLDALENANKLTSSEAVVSTIEIIKEPSDFMFKLKFNYPNGPPYFLLLPHNGYSPEQIKVELQFWLVQHIAEALKKAKSE